MTAEEETGKAANTAALTILGALAAAAFANLAFVLAAGGYEVDVLGLSIRSSTPGRPLAILVALVAARWLVSLKGVGLRRSLAGLFPWGAVLVVLGAVVFAVTVSGKGSAVPFWAGVVVAVLVLAGFALAWASWREPSSRFVVTVCLLAGCIGVAGGLSSSANWARTFGLVEPKFAAGVTVPADEGAIPRGGGTDYTLEKVQIGNQWRDAIVLAPGGFYTFKADASAPFRLRFAISRIEAAEALPATVSVSLRGTTYSTDVLAGDRWDEEDFKYDQGGTVEVTFERPDDDIPGKVLFANPRIVETGGSLGERLNVIFMIVDALRSDRMSLYGYSKPTSDEIDRLAAAAVVFDNALSASSWTVPSTATLFTSLYPTAHGATSTERGLSSGLKTLAERMREAGYATAAFQANALLAPEAGFAQGFAEYTHYPTRRPTALDANRYVRADVINRDALAWLDANDEGPFFLYLHYMDVHDPYCPPVEFRRFGEDDSGLYDGEIAYFSSQFSALFGELDKRDLLSSTIIVLASDHGEQFLEHGSTKHGHSLYGEEVSVPLVIWYPSAKSDARYALSAGALGRRITGRTSGIDIAPTILDAAGARPLSDAAGVSLFAAVLSGAVAERPVTAELHTIYPPGQHLVSVTEGKSRCIIANPGTSSSVRFELYNLASDPAERINLASSQGEAMRRRLEEAEGFVARQKQLHESLVPEEFVLPLSEERIKQLEALGYLGK